MIKSRLYLYSLLLVIPWLYQGEAQAATCKSGKLSQVYVGDIAGKLPLSQLSDSPTDTVNEVYVAFSDYSKLYRLNSDMNINNYSGHAFVSALMLAGQLGGVVTIKNESWPYDCKRWDKLLITFDVK